MSSSPNSHKTTPRPAFGTSPRSFVASVRPFIDQDYVKKLSPDEQDWLGTFNTNFYNGDFRKVRPDQPWSSDARRVSYRAKNAANRDAAHMLEMRLDTIRIDIPPRQKSDGSGDFFTWELPATDRDTSNAPAYLNTPEYRRLVWAFRDACHAKCPDWPPEQTPEHIKARAALETYLTKHRPPPERVVPVLTAKQLNTVFPTPKGRYASYVKSLAQP